MTCAQPCNCCEPVAPLTPLLVENRPALSAIAYRMGTYASFRASMLEEIVSTPELASLTTRLDDDYTVTVVDLWAAVADVLTFYQERYANEAFLRTATRRESMSRLARLIDYGLRPGIAALAWLAFTADAGKSFRVDPGLRVQSVPGQDEQPQTFEALEPVVADWRLNRRRVMPAPYGVNPLAPGSTAALVAPGQAGLAAARELAADDRIAVFTTGSAGRVEVLTLDDVRFDEDRVGLSWHGPVQGTWDADTRTAKIGRTFRLFGHTAPEQWMKPASAPVPGGIRWTLTPTAFGLGAGSTIPLEGKVEDVATGARLLVDDEAGATTLVTVTGVATTSQQLGGLTDSVTVLTVTPGIPGVTDRRTVTMYELAGAAIPFWGSAFPERLTGGTVFLPGRLVDAETIEVGRTIAAGEFEPGVRLRLEDVSPGRTVLAGDAATDPAAGTVESAAIVGSTVYFEPTPADKTSVKELGLDALSADSVTCLVSGPVPSSLALSRAQPALVVRIGDVGPRTLSLASVTTRSAAVAALEAAVRGAGTEPELAEARVFVFSGRLILVPGAKGGEIVFTGTDADNTTVDELALGPEHALTTRALRSAPLPATITLTNPAPELAVTIGPVGPRVVSPPSGVNIKSLAFSLGVEIAAADLAPPFRRSWIFFADDRLLVFPGPVDAEVAEYLRLDLALEEPLDLDAASAYLLGNVAAASHGETVRDEVLGNGNAATPFQKFALKKEPLTYLPSEQEGGAESTLSVRVNGVLWDEKPGLYRRPPTSEVYATRTEDDGFTAVQFGDGKMGAKVPTGQGNVVATYRVGSGVAGRVGAGTLSSALDRPPGLRGVTNPLAARGGADQEDVDDARENAPATVRTFGRAVSLEDFADLVRATGEVAKAQAVWVWDGLERAIHLTVAGQEAGLFAEEDLRRIGASLDRARDPNYRLRVANFTPFPVVLRATLNVDARYVSDEVVADALAAAVGALDFEAVDLGEPIHLSDVYRILQDVTGVVSVDVDELQPKRPADRNRPNVDLLPDGVTPSPLQPHVRVFPARPDPASPGIVLPAELAVVEDAARDVTVVATGSEPLMAVKGAERLYELLPAVYREQDAENGFPLRGLTKLVGDQLDLLEADVAQLWSDLFIETCRNWVIPYIGDLVSNNLLFDGGRGSTTANELFPDLAGPDLRPPVAIRTRADVAKTIYYRRRKGTLPMLEELARDVTGWPAHAVEFFELLGWTQHLEHFRPQACWFDIRSHERDERVDGAFDEASHTVDVAPISTFDGWHSIKNIGFFLWRIVHNRLFVDARQSSTTPWGFYFSPLGNPAPLFIHPRREDKETRLSTELHVPEPIRRAFFGLDLSLHQGPPPPDFTALYGLPSDPGLPALPVLSDDASLFVIVDQTPVLPASLRCRRLDDWPATRPTGGIVWIDVENGRLALGTGFDETKPVRVFMTFGFPAMLGGGAYERRAWLAKRDVAVREYDVRTGGTPPEFQTVAAALAQWQADGRPNATITIRDSRTYTLPAGITLSSLRRLTIQAANLERPHLQTRVAAGFEIDADAVPPPDPALRGGLTLCGLLVEGFLHVVGDVGRLRVLHSTIVPGRGLKEDGTRRSSDPSIIVEPGTASARLNARLRMEIAYSVCGPIECPDHAEGIWLLDSIVDGLGGAAIAARANAHSAPLHIERATLLGTVKAFQLDASESIFTGRVDTARTQAGCVRYSFVPRGSRTPRRYRCQPDLGIKLALREALETDPGLTQVEKDAIRAFVAGWMVPSFATAVYGRPAYCQLSPSCPLEIRTGAEDGSEMGAYCHLKQPQRESNLRIRLDEYLPFGLDAGLIYVT